MTTDRPGVSLGANDRVAIVAGGGRLPIMLAEGLAAKGHPPLVVMIDGEAEPADTLPFAREHIAIEDFPALPALLRRQRATHVVLAGGVARRPRLRQVRPSLALLSMLPRAMAALARGDDGLLRILVRWLEAKGFKVVGAHELLPDLIAVQGSLTIAQPNPADRRDIEAGQSAARAIGALDIGQAAVAIGGRAIALEGIEGTEGLLERVAGLRSHGRLAGRKGGVLVKLSKPGQEVRADLPSIGPETVTQAHRAGLNGIAVEADRSLILDQAELMRRAERLGLFVIGLRPDAS